MGSEGRLQEEIVDQVRREGRKREGLKRLLKSCIFVKGTASAVP